MAIRLSKAIGSTPHSWVQMQAAFDLALKNERKSMFSASPQFEPPDQLLPKIEPTMARTPIHPAEILAYARKLTETDSGAGPGPEQMRTEMDLELDKRQLSVYIEANDPEPEAQGAEAAL